MLPPGSGWAHQGRRPRRLAAMKARTSASERVLSTWLASTHPRRAVPTPNRICRASAGARWQSLSTAIVTPAATAARARAPSRSMWLGAPSTSSAVPVSTGRRVEGVEVEVVAVEVSDQPVGRMTEHVDEGVTDGGEASARQLIRILSRVIVERRQHDVEALEDGVLEVEPAVGEDVDLDAVEDRHPWELLAQRGRYLRAGARCRRARACATRRRRTSGR